MGGGSWTVNSYTARVAHKAETGKSTFDYHDTMASTTPRSGWKAHDTLNPSGVKFRESRDSAEHPESLPIAVLFDVTGSMLDIPKTLQKKGICES